MHAYACTCVSVQPCLFHAVMHMHTSLEVEMEMEFELEMEVEVEGNMKWKWNEELCVKLGSETIPCRASATSDFFCQKKYVISFFSS